MNRYDDIIGLPHHVSSRHPHMSMKERAAQFSPFAALTGYGDSVKETAKQHIRETEEKNSNSTLKLRLARSGGAAIRIVNSE